MWLYIFAVFFPGVAVIVAGRIWLGILLCLLHITIVGWIPATIVAFFLIHDQRQKKLARPIM